ncbi:MAG: MSHA pilin protein MshA [Gammaproteobacteria bacterium]|jgi:MSHA pilin protein MshA
MKWDLLAPCKELIVASVLVGAVAMLVINEFDRREAAQRSSSLDGLAGSLRSAAAFAHSIWSDAGLAAGVVKFGDEQVIDIDLLTGYPVASARGIYGVIPDLSAFTAARNGDVYVFSLAGASPSSCNVTYQTGDREGDPPSITVVNNDNGGNCY